jgi:hypothetical protein
MRMDYECKLLQIDDVLSIAQTGRPMQQQLVRWCGLLYTDTASYTEQRA